MSKVDTKVNIHSVVFLSKVLLFSFLYGTTCHLSIIFSTELYTSYIIVSHTNENKSKEEKKKTKTNPLDGLGQWFSEFEKKNNLSTNLASL